MCVVLHTTKGTVPRKANLSPLRMLSLVPTSTWHTPPRQGLLQPGTARDKSRGTKISCSSIERASGNDFTWLQTSLLHSCQLHRCRHRFWGSTEQLRSSARVTEKRNDHLAGALLASLCSGKLGQVQFLCPLTAAAGCPAHCVGLILSTPVYFPSSQLASFPS